MADQGSGAAESARIIDLETFRARLAKREQGLQIAQAIIDLVDRAGFVLVPK